VDRDASEVILGTKYPSYQRTSFNPTSPKLDAIWAGGSQSYETDKRFSNYYDYYFAGEDIKVYIDPLFSENHELDIASFSYVIKQEKQPLYGFWSYNYDSMLMGTRLITGEFTLFTRYPRRMTELIEEATAARVKDPNPRNGGVLSPLRRGIYNEIREGNSRRSIYTSEADESNLEKYWGYSQLDRISEDPFVKNVKDSGHNIFSAHPPFNLIVLYGAQEASLSPLNYSSSIGREVDNLDRMIASDTNERLVKMDNIVSPMKIVLQEVNLISMATMYNPGGQPIAENYQFIARDSYMTEVDMGFIKNQTTTNTSDSESATADQDSQKRSNNLLTPKIPI
jgi:hypothetical protein